MGEIRLFNPFLYTTVLLKIVYNSLIPQHYYKIFFLST